MFLLLLIITTYSCKASENSYEATEGTNFNFSSLLIVEEGCKWLFKSSYTDQICCYSNSENKCSTKEICRTKYFKVHVNNNTRKCTLELENIQIGDTGTYIQIHNFNFTQELSVNPDLSWSNTDIVFLTVPVTAVGVGIVIIVTLFIIHYLRKYWKEQEKEKKEDGITLLDALRNGKEEESFKSLSRKNDVMNAKDKKGNSILHFIGFPDWNERKLEMVHDHFMEKGLIGLPKSPDEKFPLQDRSKLVQIIETLNTRISINARNDIKETPLHIAAKNGKVEELEALLKISDIDVNATDQYSYTPLHYAITARNRQVDALEALLNTEGINVNATDKDLKTPLHYAALNNHTDAITKLMEHSSIQIDKKDSSGMTPLLSACSLGKYKAFEMLKLRASMDVRTEDGRNILHILAQRSSDQANKGKFQSEKVNIGKIQILKSVLKPMEMASGEETEDRQRERLDSFLSAATYEKNNSLIPSDCWQTPLETAVVDEFLEAAKLLSEYGADVWFKHDANRTPHPIHLIFHAVMKNFKKFAMSLHKKDPEKVNMIMKNTLHTYLHLAVIEEDLNAVILLLNMNIDKEAKDSEGRTALELAINVNNWHPLSKNQRIIIELNKIRTEEEKESIKTQLNECIKELKRTRQAIKDIEQEQKQHKVEKLKELQNQEQQIVKDRMSFRDQLKDLEGEGEEEKRDKLNSVSA